MYISIWDTLYNYWIKTAYHLIPLQVDQSVGNLPVEVFLGYQFFGEVVRGQRLGNAVEGEQVELERGTDRISKTSQAVI